MDSNPERHREDDPTILDSEVLYRYIHPAYWVANETSERCLSSAFMRFERGMDGISVYSAALLENENMATEAILPDQSYGLASLTAGDAREMRCGVIRDPNDEHPANFAHMLITEPTESLSLKARRKLSLALIARMTVLEPPETSTS